MKILVVDDVGYSRHYHLRMLQNFGYRVEAVASGPEALKVLERDMTFSVVLTDLMMREMDGVELLKRSLRINRLLDSGNAEPPVFILMTALRPGKDASQAKDLEKIRIAKDLGFVEVLFKPIAAEALKQTLETIKYSRGRTQIDTAGVMTRVQETINNLIGEQQLDDARHFLEELQHGVEKLNSYVSQPAGK